jgi:hypothetical protein
VFEYPAREVSVAKGAKVSLVMGPDTDGARSAGRGLDVGVRVRLEKEEETERKSLINVGGV